MAKKRNTKKQSKADSTAKKSSKAKDSVKTGKAEGTVSSKQASEKGAKSAQKETSKKAAQSAKKAASEKSVQTVQKDQAQVVVTEASAAASQAGVATTSTASSQAVVTEASAAVVQPEATEESAAASQPEAAGESAAAVQPEATEASAAASQPEAAGESAASEASAPAESTQEVQEEPTEAASEPVQKEVPLEPAPAPYVPEPLPTPRRSVAFIGSECYPFVKTGGLGDVMYALPRALTKQNCDVKVILPRYKCIPWEYQEKMIYRGAFEMDLCADGKSYYVGIMEYVWDGVVYDFIDNEEFFSAGNPYINLIDDIPRFCYFGKAALAALNYMDWTPDVIHCHDWQAGLVPVYLREMFSNTPLARSKVILTIHNLRFQGIYDIKTIRYWSNLPEYVFNKDCLMQNYLDANMMKGGLTYSNMITTVSGTYAGEIQTAEYGETLDPHLRYHSGKLRGIVNGIDCEMWDPAKDKLLRIPYDITNVLEQKRKNKLALQEELGLNQDENLFVIGLISRLTNQKGLDLVNAILPAMIDGNTQVVVLGTGDAQYEDSFRTYEWQYKGSVCSNIMYDEGRAHKIYAGADALLVPSLFEPCGLTQLIAMRYGTIPIVRETGGLKDTVLPYNQYTNDGNGFTFDRYEAGLLLDAVNRAKTLYFTERGRWNDMIQRDMHKDVSWENSAKQYRQLYVDMTC